MTLSLSLVTAEAWTSINDELKLRLQLQRYETGVTKGCSEQLRCLRLQFSMIFSSTTCCTKLYAVYEQQADPRAVRYYNGPTWYHDDPIEFRGKKQRSEIRRTAVLEDER